MAENHALGSLVDWYASHCDGEWEHSYGIKIETLDNPGWHLKIDLRGTSLESVPFKERRFNYDDEVSWWVCKRDQDCFIAACGARELDAVIQVFKDWAKDNERQRVVNLLRTRSAT